MKMQPNPSPLYIIAIIGTPSLVLVADPGGAGYLSLVWCFGLGPLLRGFVYGGDPLQVHTYESVPRGWAGA
jgi:hypothetical protein